MRFRGLGVQAIRGGDPDSRRFDPEKHIPNPLRMRKAVYERDLNNYQYCSYQYYVGLLKMLLLSANPTLTVIKAHLAHNVEPLVAGHGKAEFSSMNVNDARGPETLNPKPPNPQTPKL